MTRYGLVVDRERCVGCRACAVACTEENDVPAGSSWTRMLPASGDLDASAGITPPDDEPLAAQFTPVACQHCENAPCVTVCPVGATYTRDDGIVDIDVDRCVGCRYCMAACPYDARVFVRSPLGDGPMGGTTPDRQTGVVEKCTFCSHRVDDGLDPACVADCPANARIFGDLDDPASTVSRYVARYDTERLLVEDGVEPKTFYVAGETTPGRPWTGDALETELSEAERTAIRRDDAQSGRHHPAGGVGGAD